MEAVFEKVRKMSIEELKNAARLAVAQQQTNANEDLQIAAVVLFSELALRGVDINRL